MKKGFFVFCLFLFAFLNSNFAQNEAPEQLLWKISKDGMQTSYLFGTMHVRDSRVFNFSDSVYLAIEACNSFALEVHPDSFLMESIKTFMDEQGEESEDLLEETLSDEEVERYKKKFEELNGYTFDEEEKIDPVAILDGLKGTEPDFGEDVVVDVHLLRIAKMLSKKITGLESRDNQIYLMGYTDKGMFKKNLLEMMDTTFSPGLRGVYFEQLIKSYQSKNLDEMEMMVGPKILIDSINILRNTDMANSIERISKTESLFSAVGVAHLLGENSVIKMLREKGFTVEAVQTNYTDVKSRFAYDVNKLEWFMNKMMK